MTSAVKRILLSPSAITPDKLPGLAAWYDASDASTVLTSVGPDVPATDGQTVRRWLSRHNPAVYWDQSTLANQPVFTNATTGLTFNGTSKFMNGTSTMADVFRNRGYGYIFAVVQDTNPTGGAAGHTVIHWNTNSGIFGRITLSTRNFTNILQIVGRRLDSDSAVIINCGANNAYLTLFEYQARWAAGTLELYGNGASLGNGSYASSGNTSDTASLIVALGTAGDLGSNFFPGNIREIVIVNEQLTATQIAATRRYLQRKWGTP